MDRDLIEAKIESLRRCIERIASKTPASADQLAGDPDLQDIIALNLQRAVQLCVDLAAYVIADTNVRPPSTMAENFVILKELSVIHPALTEGMMKAVGFRNIAVQLSSDRLENRLSDLQQPSWGLQTVCSVNHSPAAIFLTLLQSRFLCPPRMEEMRNTKPKLPESCQLTSRWRAQTWCSLVLAPCALVSRGTWYLAKSDGGAPRGVKS